MTSLLGMHLLLMGVTAILLFMAASRLATDAMPIPAGVVAAVIFLCHPLPWQSGLFLATSDVLGPAVFAVLFVSTWFGMEHWSPFMRSVVLTVLMSASLWLRSAAAPWIILSLIPWVLFSRRPLTAAGTFFSVAVLGPILFLVMWILLALVRGHEALATAPLHAAYAWFRALPGEFVSLSDLGSVGRRFVGDVAWMSVGWVALVLWLSHPRFRKLLAERRADAATFTLILSWVAWGASLVRPMSPAYQVAGLVAFVALTAILIGADFGCKEYILNRSARTTVLVAGGVSAAAFLSARYRNPVPGLALLLTVQTLAILGAVGITKILPNLKRQVEEVRWQSVLMGGSLGWSLAALALLTR